MKYLNQRVPQLLMMLVLLLIPLQSISQLDTVTLQLKWKHQFQFAGYYAAIQQGFYEKEGLFVKLVEIEADKEPHLSVVHQKAQFGVASSDLAIIRSKGLPVVLLANIFQHSPWIFLTLEKTQISNVHQLAGKRIMIEDGASELLAYLKYESISMNSIEFVPHTFDINKLLAGEVDAISAYLSDESFVAKESGNNYFQFNPRASGIDFYGDVLYTSENELAENPKRVKAFLRASIQGWKYALKHQDEIVDLIYTQYSQRHSRAHLAFEAQQTNLLIVPDIIEVGYINKGRWQRIVEVYAELGMIDQNIDLDLFIYNPYIKQDFTPFYILFFSVLIVFGIVFFFLLKYRRMVSNLKRESTEKKETEQQLRLLEKRYRMLVKNAPFSIIISKLSDNKILYVNKKASFLFDITKEHALSKDLVGLFTNKQEYEKIDASLNEHGYIDNYEIEMQKAGKIIFWASISVSLVQFDRYKAKIIGIVDITERKLLESHLKQANQTKNKFFSILAHDLRSPIGNFQKILEMLLSDLPRFNDPENQKKILVELNKSAKSTFLLLENLLQWSKSEQGLMEINPQEIELKKLVDDLIPVFSLELKLKQITLEIIIDEACFVYTDTHMLKVVIRNLISNAIKFTEQAGEIKLYAKMNEKEIEFYVEDNGIGIEKNIIPQLFDSNKHVTSYGTNNEKGSGLGLVLCKDFVEKQGGQISVESKKNEGSTFMFTIPLY